MTTLVTGAAGFIGMHVAKALLSGGERVIGIDNFTPYYAPRLKHARIAQLEAADGPAFDFVEVDFGDDDALARAVAGTAIDRIVHLGAQAGVRYSIDNPRAYIHSYISGHLNFLELARVRAV